MTDVRPGRLVRPLWDPRPAWYFGLPRVTLLAGLQLAGTNHEYFDHMFDTIRCTNCRGATMQRGSCHLNTRWAAAHCYGDMSRTTHHPSNFRRPLKTDGVQLAVHPKDWPLFKGPASKYPDMAVYDPVQHSVDAWEQATGIKRDNVTRCCHERTALSAAKQPKTSSAFTGRTRSAKKLWRESLKDPPGWRTVRGRQP
jgi:hypothetical protein